MRNTDFGFKRKKMDLRDPLMGTTIPDNTRVTEDDEVRITEDGEIRVTEDD